MSKVKDWFHGLFVWLRMFLPTQRAVMLRQAREFGRIEGARTFAHELANLNRAQRRQAVRNIVKQYKD